MKVLKIVLNILGIIFLMVIIILAYLWFFDPFEIRNILGRNVTPISVIKTVTGNNPIKIDNIDKNPLLNEQQEAQLEAIGVDPSDLPAEITPLMKTCFTEKLGSDRNDEIIAGSAPTAMDFIKASSCLKTE